MTKTRITELKPGDRIDYMGSRTVISVEQTDRMAYDIHTINDYGFQQTCFLSTVWDDTVRSI